MNCHDAQAQLSIYLYGELDFAHEEELEAHLSECAFCQLSLEREKKWHTLAFAEVREPSLDLLASGRQQLRSMIARESSRPHSATAWWRNWTNPFQISFTRWSPQVAIASMLVFIGFASARWIDRHGVQAPVTEMSLLNPANAQIRDVQTDGDGRIRIVYNQQREVTGNVDDAPVRSLLFAGTRQADPGLRFAAFEVLSEHPAAQASAEFKNDLRDAVVYSVRNDPNAAVRLQAITALRGFVEDPASLEAFKFVLENDEDAGVRSQAINILVPQDSVITITPAMAQAMQDIMRSPNLDDEYVRARCTQALHEARLPIIY